MSTRPLLLLGLMACAAEEPLGGPAVVYGEARPPEAPVGRAEVAPPPPSAAHVWLGGHWEWASSGYVWMPGQWVLRPRADAAWVSPHWDVRGRHHVFVSGYWR